MKFTSFLLGCIVSLTLVIHGITLHAKGKSIHIQKMDTITVSDSTERSTSTSFSLDVASDYIWRDLVYGFNVIQPTMQHNFKSLPVSFNMWTSAGVKFQTNDIELSSTLSYSVVSTDASAKRKRSKNIASQYLDVEAGIVHYAIPLDTSLRGRSQLETNSAELFTLFSYTRWPIVPNAEVYVNVNGPIYYSFSLSTTLFSEKRYALDLGAIIGYRERERTLPQDNLQHFTSYFALPLPFIKNIEVNLFGNYIYRFKLKDQHSNIGITINF